MPAILILVFALVVGCGPQTCSELADALRGHETLRVRQAADLWVGFRNDHPTLHLALGSACIAWLLLAALAAPALTAYGRGKALLWLLRSRTSFFVVAGLLLLLCRGPTLAQPELNPDESQLLAGALALKHDPRFWRSVDGTTFGPLDYFALLPTQLLGLSLDYGSSKLVGLVLAWGTLICLFAALRCALDEGPARLLTLPLLVLYSRVTNIHLLPYLSEALPCFLIALATAMTMRLSVRSPRLPGIVVLGLVLPAIPFAKLQAAPVGLALGLMALWLCWRSHGTNRRRAVFGLLLASVGAPALALGTLWAAGELREFWSSYFAFNLRYEVKGHPLWLRAALATSGWYETREFRELIAACGALCAFAAAMAVAWRRPACKATSILVAGVLLCASLFAAFFPGRAYLHYLHFVPFPALLLSGLLAGYAFQGLPSRSLSRVLVPAVAVLILALAAPRTLLGQAPRSITLVGGPVAATVLAYASTGEALGVWGWMPRHYVETGMYPATRDLLTQRQILPTPMRRHHKERYMAELTQALPPVFVDAVGPGNFAFTDTRAGVSSFRALHALLESQYVLVADVSGSRIFVRRDRAGQLEDGGTILRESLGPVQDERHLARTLRIRLDTASRASLVAHHVTLVAAHRRGTETLALLWSSAPSRLLDGLEVLDARSGERLLPGSIQGLDLGEHRDLRLAFESWLDLSRDELVVTFRGSDGAPLVTLRSSP